MSNSKAALLMLILTMLLIAGCQQPQMSDSDPTPTLSGTELAAEINAMAAAEQALRSQLVQAMHGGKQPPADLTTQLGNLDAMHTERIKQMLDNHGWPTYDLVGKEAGDNYWLILQHSPDHQFMVDALPLMEEQVKREQASGSCYALLLDRVLMYDGKPQVYGTQFTMRNGTFEPWTIEDHENLDARRAAVGLPPFAEYEKSIREAYGQSTD